MRDNPIYSISLEIVQSSNRRIVVDFVEFKCLKHANALVHGK